MLPVRVISLAAVLLLCGCDMLAPKPRDMSAQTVPQPPVGTPNLYADGGGVSLQVRPGDCAVTECLALKEGRWRPLPKTPLRTLPLLAVSEATGSDYSDGLWRSVASGRAVLLNASAAQQTMAAGHLDGLRIGLKDGQRRTYVTAYAIEDVKSGGQPSGDGRAFTAVDADVMIHGGTAWLLHRRPDRSGNLIDLFAVLARPGAIHCLPGMVIDTRQWAGPVETALSPNLFVSRAIDASQDASRRQAVIAACPARPAKPTLKERLGL